MFSTDSLHDSARQVAGVDVRSCTDGELLDAVAVLAAARDLIETAEAHVLSELDARGSTDIADGMRTVAWAARATGGARGPICGRLKVGRALRDPFDEIDRALCDGALTFDHAKALVHAANPRVADVLAGAQDEIITLADNSTFEQWKRDVIALAEYADPDGPEPDPCASNELRLSKTLDGRVEINGSLDAANGLALSTAINAKADELFRRCSHDHKLTPDLEIPSRKALRAEALVELIRAAMGAEPGSGSIPRAEVTLVLHNNQVTDPDGAPLPQAAADVWGCDPDLWAIIVNDMGIPVDVGRTQRLATIAQRRAIAVRDGGCTFPGCDAPINWCDHHHIDDWNSGGETDLSNLVALCRYHHGITHRTGWTMHLDDQQVPHWTSPSGDHFTGQRHHRPCETERHGEPERPPDQPETRHDPGPPDRPPPLSRSDYRAMTLRRLTHSGMTTNRVRARHKHATMGA